MPTRWLITEDEDDRMQGLSCEAQAMYMRAFRRYADYSNGHVAVTHGQLKRTVEFIPDAGSHDPPRRVADISNHFVRARIAELERVGLIRKLPKNSRFDTPAYCCVFAATASIRPEKEPQRNRKERTAKGAASENTVLTGDSDTSTARGTAKEPQGGNRQIPGIRKDSCMCIPPLPPQAAEWIDPEIWADWIEHRKNIKHPATDVVCKKAIKELGLLKAQGHDPNRVLEHCILNGWRGIFPPKDAPAAAHNNGRDYSQRPRNEGSRHEQRKRSTPEREYRTTNPETLDWFNDEPPGDVH